MKWSDVQPGDVCLDCDTSRYSEALDFVVVAKDGLRLTILVLGSGVVEHEVFPNIEIPGFYDVIRGGEVIQEAAQAGSIVWEGMREAE